MKNEVVVEIEPTFITLWKYEDKKPFRDFLVFLISWFVFRSRLNDIIKATFLTMPLMVILVMVGISLHQQSKWVIAGIGAFIICAVLSYLYKKKLSWLYYFSTFYVAVLAFCVMLFNVQI